jgi:hypothetical protein
VARPNFHMFMFKTSVSFDLEVEVLNYFTIFIHPQQQSRFGRKRNIDSQHWNTMQWLVFDYCARHLPEHGRTYWIHHKNAALRIAHRLQLYQLALQSRVHKEVCQHTIGISAHKIDKFQAKRKKQLLLTYFYSHIRR